MMNPTEWTRVLAPAGLCCALLTGCGGDDAVTGSGVTASDSAGVRVVEFADLERLDLPERSTAVTGEIGGAGGIELFRVSAARLLDGDRLAVGNSGTFEILYFQPTGALAQRVGREGEGPGEFKDITSFPGGEGDTLTVYDTRVGRLTVLDGEGRVVETRPLQPPSRAVDLLPLTVGDDGRVVAVHGEARIFGTSGVRTDTVPLMVIGPSTAVDTVSLWPGKQWSFAATERGTFRTEVGFGYSVEASGGAGHAVIGSTARLSLSVLDARGEPVMRIAATGPGRPVSQDAVRQWRRDRLAGLADDVPASIRRAIEKAPHNDTLPAFSGLLMDADRRIWIGATVEAGAGDRRWTVLGPDGEPAFRVVLPASARPLDASGDRLVVSDRTDLDEEVIRMVRVDPSE